MSVEPARLTSWREMVENTDGGIVNETWSSVSFGEVRAIVGYVDALHALIDAAGYFRRYDVSINGRQLNWWAAREIVRPSKDKITTTTAPTRGEQQP